MSRGSSPISCEVWVVAGLGRASASGPSPSATRRASLAPLRELERYGEGPSSFEREALERPTPRAVAEGLLRGAADVQTDPRTPAGCLATLGTTYCADASSPVGKMLIASRLAGHAAIRERFERASRAEGDLSASADPHALTHYIGTVVCGMAVLAASGATRQELERVIELAMRAWPQ